MGALPSCGVLFSSSHLLQLSCLGKCRPWTEQLAVLADKFTVPQSPELILSFLRASSVKKRRRPGEMPGVEAGRVRSLSSAVRHPTPLRNQAACGLNLAASILELAASSSVLYTQSTVCVSDGFCTKPRNSYGDHGSRRVFR